MKIDIKLSEDFHICERALCYNKATEKHHLYSDTKQARKLYGKLIDADRNIKFLCYDCHHNRPLKKLTEKEFCELLGIMPRSKTALLKKC